MVVVNYFCREKLLHVLWCVLELWVHFSLHLLSEEIASGIFLYHEGTKFFLLVGLRWGASRGVALQHPVDQNCLCSLEARASSGPNCFDPATLSPGEAWSG